MPLYTVSRGAYMVHTTTIEADNEDEAIDKAKQLCLDDWRNDTDPTDTDVLYQIESEE